MTILKTERLTLRPITRGDEDRHFDLMNNWNVAGNLARVPWPYLKEYAVEHVEKHVLAPAPGCFAIDLPGDGLIGVVVIGDDNPDFGAPEGTKQIGYWVGEPYWGQGYVTEACRAALTYGFDEMQLNEIFAGVLVDNPASIRVLEKLGFEHVGAGEINVLARGEKVASHRLRLGKSRWRATQAIG
ncbi:MAG: GNAT family N-acetyltransferase [Alphaproteobacteria bacterium]